MTDLLILQNLLSPSSSSSSSPAPPSSSSTIVDNNLYANIFDPTEYLSKSPFQNYTADHVYYDYNSNYYYNTLNKTLFLFDTSLLANDTAEERPSLLLSPSLTVLFAILSGLMSLTTILGNILVITAFIIDKNLRSYSNYFILNLSIADLLIGLLIPPYAPFLLANRRWAIGRAACTIWLVLDYVVGSASVLCIVVISLDRYLLVSRGLSYITKQSVQKAICMMATVWIIAFLNYAPAIVFWELISGKSTVPEGDCQVEFHNNLPYLTATACVEFFVPFFTICTLNIAVYLNIRKRSKGLIRSKNPQFCIDKGGAGAGGGATTGGGSGTCKTTKGGSIKGENGSIKANKQSEQGKLKLNKVVISISPSTSSASSDVIASCQLNNGEANTSVPNSPTDSKSPANMTSKQHPESCPTFQTQFETQKSVVTIKAPDTPTRATTVESNGAKLSITKLRTSHTETTTLIRANGSTSTNAKKTSVAKNSTSNSLSKDKKAARSLFILVFVFVCCWAPYTASTLVKAVCPTCIGDTLYEITFWLLWLNSTFNPILYPFLHVKFRKAFAKIICCCMKKSQKFKFKLKSDKTNDNNNANATAAAANNVERNRLIATSTSTTLVKQQQQNSTNNNKKAKIDV